MNKIASNALLPAALLVICSMPAMACSAACGDLAPIPLAASDTCRMIDSAINDFSWPFVLFIVGSCAFFAYWKHACESMLESCAMSIMTAVVLFLLLHTAGPMYLSLCCTLASLFTASIPLQFLLALWFGLSLPVATVQFGLLELSQAKVRLGLLIWVIGSSSIVTGVFSILFLGGFAASKGLPYC